MPDDIRLLQKLLQDLSFSPGWKHYGQRDFAELALLQKLNTIKGCPLTLFDDVVSWVKKHLLETDKDSDQESDLIQNVPVAKMLRSRHKCLIDYESRSNMIDMRPVTKDIPLIKSSGTARTTKVPFLHSLYYLLTDANLTKSENLLPSVLTNNHVSPGVSQSNTNTIYKDIDTGLRYQSAKAKLELEEMDLALELVFFGDASVLDPMSGRMKTDMLTYTLGIFNCETRYSPEAWASIRSIPLLTKVEHKNANNKLVDYHQIVQHLLDEPRSLMHKYAGQL